MADLLNIATLWQPLATSLGAFSAFPEQPKLLQDLAQNEWFRWFLVFVLILQGGAGWRVDLALVATIITFVIVKLLDGAYFSRECPVPVPAEG